MADPRLTVCSKLNIGFLSLSSEPGIDDLLIKIKNASLKLNCVFTKLNSKDLQLYEPQGNFDGVVLLHSISQGRNSITDVADARYKNLLPQLSQRYGSHRVGVVVHSLSSYNPATKDALMLVFRKSQPTCFKCSNCVIQCGKLEEIPDSELARIVRFLEEVRNHPLPTATEGVEVTPTQATQMSHHKAMDVGLRSIITAKPIESQSSHTHRASEVSHTVVGTQDTKIMKTDMESAHNTPEGIKDDSTTLQVQHQTMAHETEQPHFDNEAKNTFGDRRQTIYPESQMNPCSHEHSDDSDKPSVGGRERNIPTPLDSKRRDEALVHPLMPSPTADRQGLPTSIHHQKPRSAGGASGHEEAVTPNSSSSGERYPVSSFSSHYDHTAALGLETTYPVALIVIPTATSTQETEAAVKRILPGKIIISSRDLSPFRNNWHIFEVFLIDIGRTPITTETPAFGYIQEIQQKMGTPKNVAVLTQNQSDGNSAPYMCQTFAYNRSHGSASVVFDERIAENFKMWMRDCHQRFLHSLSHHQRVSVFARAVAFVKTLMNP